MTSTPTAPRTGLPAGLPADVVLDDALVDRYLERLGLPGRPGPTLQALSDLQEAHVLTVPFENLDYHYGAEILMDARVVGKIVDQRRGGGCYELNPSLHYLLLNLGFASRILAARGATIADFAPTLWWWRTCPDSPFLQSIFCSIPTRTGRVTLTGDRLTVVDGPDRTVEALATGDVVLAAYSRYFGMPLTSLPQACEHHGRRAGIRLE